jgi:hypothetical protein
VPLRVCLAGCALALVALVPASAATNDLRISGATAKERALMRQVVAGVQPTAIDSVRFRKPPRAWKPIPKHSVLLDLGASKPGDSLTIWQAWLVVGAYRDRAAKAHLRRVAFYSLARLQGEEGRLGRPRKLGRVATPAQVAAAISLLRAGAEASGATADVSVLTPLGIAPMVTLRFSDPAHYLKDRFDSFVSALRKLGPTDGVHLEGIDENGGVVFEYGSSVRAGSVEIWVQHGLETCNAFFDHSWPTNPPPCPAQSSNR